MEYWSLVKCPPDDQKRHPRMFLAKWMSVVVHNHSSNGALSDVGRSWSKGVCVDVVLSMAVVSSLSYVPWMFYSCNCWLLYLQQR